MIDFIDSELVSLALHQVGNKVQDENLKFGNGYLELDRELNQLLKKYFTKPFKDAPFYHFEHTADLNLNEMFVYARTIFSDEDKFIDVSKNIAEHLYEVSDHPNIKGGELYIFYLSDCYVGDEVADAIGVFKSESKETYIKVYPENNNFKIESNEGVSINKIDKGCLIFNTEEEHGFKVVSIDNTNKGNEAVFWNDKFLKIKPREDNYYQTRNYMQLCKDFAVEAFSEADKIDQLSLVNDSQKYFKEEEQFDKVSFHEKVLQEPEIIQAFEEYKQEYIKEREINIVDEFDIAPKAVKSMGKVFKSVIKLDKNFHIYVHGNRDHIKKGYDEEGQMHYYQLFFKEES